MDDIPSRLATTLQHAAPLAACLLSASSLLTPGAQVDGGGQRSGPAPAPLAAMRVQHAVPAELIRVIDGDTVEMRMLIWLDQHVTTRVRLRGIDAPERSSRCAAEARQAEAASAELLRTLAGRPLFLTQISRDKYGGRVVAKIVTGDGADIGERLVAGGHARLYAGGRRGGWCG
jgi:micrococcal nuclease